MVFWHWIGPGVEFVLKGPIDTVNITPISSCSVTTPSIRSPPASECALLLWRGRGCQAIDLPLTIVSGTDSAPEAEADAEADAEETQRLTYYTSRYLGGCLRQEGWRSAHLPGRRFMAPQEWLV